MEEGTGQKREWIDFFKGLAICGVVLVHSGCGALKGICGWFGASGAYGVQMFLIIAIYLSCHSLERREKTEGKTWRTSWKWFLERVWRLTPLYYLALAVYVLIIPGNMNIWLGSMAEGVSSGNIVAHLFYVHSLFPYYANSIMWVEWYLGVLVIYYLALPVVFGQIRSLKRAAVFVIVVILLSVSITGVLSKLQPLTDQYIWDGWVDTYSFIRQLPAFAVGIFLYWLEKILKENEKKSSLNIVGKALILTGISGFIVFSLFERKADLWFYHMMLISLLSISFGLMLGGALCYKRKVFGNRLLTVAGRNSYGIYLFHYLVIVILDVVIDRLGNPSEAVSVGVKFGAAMISCMVFSICYEKIVGKRITMWGKNKIAKL